MKTLDKNNLKISVLLYNFINEEVIPGTNIESGKFWEGFSNAVHELAPINKQFLKKREDIQNKINKLINDAQDLHKTIFNKTLSIIKS